MTIDKFKELLFFNNAIRLNDEYIVFNDNELYSFRLDKGKKYKSVEELIEDRADIREIIEKTEDFTLDYDMPKGGRGGNRKMGGGFKHADLRGKGKISGEVLHPAELNLKTAKNSLENVLKRFQDKYANADIEYAISIDEQGFVHQHIKGGSVAVQISGGKGETIIHNHPRRWEFFRWRFNINSKYTRKRNNSNKFKYKE